MCCVKFAFREMENREREATPTEEKRGDRNPRIEHL